MSQQLQNMNRYKNYRVFTQKLEEHLTKNGQFQLENFKSISGVKIAFSGHRLIEDLFKPSEITPILGINKSQLFNVFKIFKNKLDGLDIRPLLVFEGI